MSWWLQSAAAAVAGACAGSILNAYLARWPDRESRESLPPDRAARLPLVQVAVALIWAGVASRWGLHWEALRGSLFLTILLGIALTDARRYIIPDRFSLGGCLVGLGLAPLPGGPTLAAAVFGAGVGFGVLWCLAWLGRITFGRDAMGGGDIKMMAMVGAFLGPAGVPLTLFVGALLGSIIFGPIAYRTARLVPFGIFLAVGAGVAYGWGDPLITWYLGLLGLR